MTVQQTNSSGDTRQFALEIVALNMTVNGAYGPAFVRESPTVASAGQLTATQTNGGYLISGFLNLNLEVSVDGGGTWYLSSPPVYLELSGPPGTPAILSVARANETNVMICWSTQAGGNYQLQRKESVSQTNWTNVGTAQAGGSTLCVNDTLSAASNGFYRVQLSP
jgi:hypothetical protein